LVALSLDLLNTALVVVNAEFRAVYFNQAAEQLLGVSARHIQQDNFFELIRCEFDPQPLAQLASNSQSSYIEETQIRTASGTISASLMLSGFQQSGQSFLLLEFQSSEHHSHIRKDMELQQQSRVSNHLIRNLTHEIKNPLGGIKGAAQLLERKFDDAKSSRYTQIIIQEADRLSHLVDRMLLPAAPEDKQLVNIHRLLENAVEVVLLQQDTPIQVVKDYDPSLPELMLCAGQIQQSLLNLIKNAVEAIDGKGEIRLRTRILLQHTIGNRQHRQVIRVDIIDNGVGIPESLLKDIFFPTISGKNSSGLGLSIAQSLVQRHGGIIEVESQPAHTCFSIYLPLEWQHDSTRH